MSSPSSDAPGGLKIKNVAHRYVTLTAIFRGVIPFLAADLIIVLIMVLFPAAILFLPGLMN